MVASASCKKLIVDEVVTRNSPSVDDASLLLGADTVVEMNDASEAATSSMNRFRNVRAGRIAGGLTESHLREPGQAIQHHSSCNGTTATTHGTTTRPAYAPISSSTSSCPPCTFALPFPDQSHIMSASVIAASRLHEATRWSSAWGYWRSGIGAR